MAVCGLLRRVIKMLVKDLIKQLENLPQDQVVGIVDAEGYIIYPNGSKIEILNNLEITLIR